MPVKYKHLPEFYFATTASGLVRGIVIWESLLELQGNTFAHYPNRIHGVDECLGVGTKKIAFCLKNHQ